MTATHWGLLAMVEKTAAKVLPFPSHTTIKLQVYDDLDEISVIVAGSSKDWHMLLDLVEQELIFSGRKASLADPQLPQLIEKSLEVYSTVLLYGNRGKAQ